MKATITLKITYDEAACRGLTHAEVEAALKQEINHFVSRGGLTPTIILADDCNLVVDEHTSKVEVIK